MLEKYVLTGGPGTGKTTLLKELAKRGYQTVPEAARLVIQEEQRKEQGKGEQGILPWTDLYKFQKIFLLEFLPFYHQDPERREDGEKAREIHYHLEQVYQEFGYQPVHIPVLPAAQRALSILHTLNQDLNQKTKNQEVIRHGRML